MADNQDQQPRFVLPTRTITITGERCARMLSTTVRVSQMDQKLVQMSMSNAPNVRDLVSRAADQYHQAFSHFEETLKNIEKQLENSRNDRTRSKSKAPRAEAKPVLSRDPGKRQDKGQQNNNQQGKATPQSGGAGPAIATSETKSRGAQQPAQGKQPKPAGERGKTPTPDAAPAPAAETVSAPAPAPTQAATETSAAPAALEAL
ncbi:hypothetical protein [Pseudomonas syringae]|uniref:hypothetical protein n=1 Tax=Pseudomonas syringae TaxID=317 RepID=UPI001F15A11B|nr:hypothetical protein [Pseudomonas syringae]MCF5374477.1 hypothetical protein [Pseudomonas syringae]MCF5381962.1 hypothetical protein [Pseudomonas syringae]MCF5419506.1 hypothetical protein [Pseudomonas syringae]MCF5454720.1 hypothetical protein [Pseudomonas syringae]MCF5460642.1 hypothetical protein [Pseudomonas syringae]